MLPETRMTRTPRASRSLPDLRAEMDRLLSDFFTRPATDASGAAPATDLYETDEAFVAEVEVPGYARDDVDVAVEQGVLTVSGRRVTEREEENADYRVRERATGRFSRSFSLPRSIEQDRVGAELNNGILRITMPKAEEARSRRIEVDVK